MATNLLPKNRQARVSDGVVLERVPGGTRKMRCPITNNILTPTHGSKGQTVYQSGNVRFVTKKF